MEVRTAKKLRNELADTIRREVKEFETRTGLEVEMIDLVRVDTSSRDLSEPMTLTQVHVQIKL